MAQRSRRTPTWPLFIALFVILADEISQYFVIRYVQPLGPAGVPLIGSLFRLVYLENTGVSFGQLQQFSAGITILTAVVVVGLCVGYRYFLLPSRWANLAFGLILGGAIGNLIDRLLTGARLGLANAYVVDFFDLRYFAVFNVADSALTVGGILYGVYFVFFHKEGARPKEQDPCPPAETPPPPA